MPFRSKILYALGLIIAISALFTPIAIKFLYSELPFFSFIASLSYGLDVATTIGFVGAIFVFWISKDKEHRDEARIAEEKKAQLKRIAEEKREKALIDQQKLRNEQLLDNSRATSISFLQQTNDDISESLVQFERRFASRFNSLKENLYHELKISDVEGYQLFINVAKNQADNNERYAFSYKSSVSEFASEIVKLEDEFSVWSNVVEKTIRGRFFNLLPIVRSMEKSLLNGETNHADTTNVSDDQKGYLDFLNLLDNVVNARGNIATLLQIFEKIDLYHSEKLENQAFDDQESTVEYFRNLLNENVAFGIAFENIFTGEDLKKYQNFLSSKSLNDFVGGSSVIDKLVFSIVKPEFDGVPLVFDAINQCVTRYIECLENVAIYCAALQETILKSDNRCFDEAYSAYRRIMNRTDDAPKSPFQHEKKSTGISTPRFSARAKKIN